MDDLLEAIEEYEAKVGVGGLALVHMDAFAGVMGSLGFSFMVKEDSVVFGSTTICVGSHGGFDWIYFTMKG